MKHQLVITEKEARRLRDEGRLHEAAALFCDIIKEQPDWEHGGAFYELACCYEDLGQLVQAEKCYRNALNFAPKNPYFLGGYASFLYLHGDPKAAFDVYIELLQLEHRYKNQSAIEAAMIGLKSLGKRIGWSDQAVADKIKEITT